MDATTAHRPTGESSSTRELTLAQRFLNHRVWGRDGNRGWWLIVLFGMVILGGMWSATLARIAFERNLIIRTATRETEELASTFEQRTLRTLKNADVTTLILKDQFEQTGRVDIGRAIAKRIIPADAYLVISVVDARGQIVASSDPRAVGVLTADRDYFRRHKAIDNGVLDVSQPVALKVSGRIAIQLTRRLNAGDGSFAGIVLLSVDPAFFTDFYSVAELGEHGTLALLGIDGIFRARRVGTGPASVPEGVSSNIVTRALDKPNGSFAGVSPVDGVSRVVAYRTLREFPLVVLASQSESDVLVEFNERRQLYLATASAGTGIVLLFLFVLTALAWGLKQSRQRAWERARELKLASTVYETTLDGIMVTDADDRIVMVNAAFTRLTGYPAGDLLGRILAESAFRPIDPVESAQRWEQMTRDGHVTGEVTRLRKDGIELSLWITATVVYDGAGAVANYIRVFTDISAIKESRRQLEAMLRLDVLTGLQNRRAFHDALSSLIGTAKRDCGCFALIFVDLDYFKRVNDNFGHEAGDRLLKNAAAALTSCVRATDSIFRFGGDEFTILLGGGANLEDATKVSERINIALGRLSTGSDSAPVTTASVGIALYPIHGVDAATLMKNADVAMYVAKSSGRGGYAVFTVDGRVAT